MTIPSFAGGTQIIRDFAIEERTDGKYVLRCEAPFLVQNPSVTSREA